MAVSKNACKWILVNDSYGDTSSFVFDSKPTSDELKEVIVDNWGNDIRDGDGELYGMRLYKVQEEFKLESSVSITITDDCS